MKRKLILLVMLILLFTCFTACSIGEKNEEKEIFEDTNLIAEQENPISEEETVESLAESDEPINHYYTNEQGVRVDKVTQFEIKAFGDFELKIPILNEGIDEVVVYEFDTYDGIHVVIDASNVYQQTNLDEIGDYGDVQLENIAPGKDIVYMYDGECYYIEDYTRNLLTISKPINN